MRIAILIATLAFSQATSIRAADPETEASQASSSTAEAVVHAPSETLLELFGRVEKLETQAKKQRVLVEGFGQIRFDGLQYKAVAIGSPQGVTPLVHTQFDSYGGIYVKRLEIKLSGDLIPQVRWIAGYGLEEGKLKDVGLEWTDPGLLGDLDWIVQLGQFRQKFGIEPQTSSSKIPFIERALMYGGAHPLPMGLKLAGERVLGIHSSLGQRLGWAGYEAGLSVSNDGSDQIKETNTLAAAFPTQPLNGRSTLTGRFGVIGGPLKLGASFQNDDRTQRVYAGGLTATSGVTAVSYGADLVLEALKDRWWLQAEWIKQDGYSDVAGSHTASEAWYAHSILKLADIPELEQGRVELLARYERLAPVIGMGAFPGYLTSFTFGLNIKAGRSTTVINLTEFAPEDHFTEAGDLRRILLQQQFVY